MADNMDQDKILILDFGSQYTQLIARRVREAGVYSEIKPFNLTEQALVEFDPKGIILSGGPESVFEKNAPSIPQKVLDLGCPVLGICYGMQAMAAQLGGEVVKAEQHEYGYAKIEVTQPNALFEGLDYGLKKQPILDVWMSHGDHIVKHPPGFEVYAKSKNAPIAAMGHDQKKWYGLQFHPEVTHTVQGQVLLERFIHGVCGCEATWISENIIEDHVTAIRNQVGSSSVVLGLSGGVDSSVTAALLHRAIGAQLTCIFVDTGLLRLNEAEEVLGIADQLGIKLVHVQAQKMYFEQLKGITCPEEKRKYIGRLFIEIFEAQASKLKNVRYLAQGTIYPDVIESAGGKNGQAKVIKSHHNVGGLPEKLNLKLIEPLRDLFKDEVRELGTKLGLPRSLLERHPFPGPGLGVRILGEVKSEYVTMLQQADDVFIQALKRWGYYDKVQQAFVVFLPVKSVGVTGDSRRYEYVVSLRAVETQDFMTAQWARLPYEFLEQVSSQIINDIPGISRVTYDISSKPPATIEWE